MGTDIVDRDGDLAVGLLAQLAAVLAVHADGVLALLGGAGIVDDKDPLGAGEGLSHHAAVAMEDLLFVPGALVDALLQGLWGIFEVPEFSRERDPVHHGLNAFTLALLDQAAKVDAAPGALGLVAEVIAEQFGIIPKSFQDVARQFGGEGLVHTIHTNKAPGRFRII